MGESVLAALQSPRPPPIEAALTTLISEMAAVSQGDREGEVLYLSGAVIMFIGFLISLVWVAQKD